MLMKLTREIRTLTIALVVLAIGACQSSPNAAPNRILAGYQPDIPVNPKTTTSERKGPNEFFISLIRLPNVATQKNSNWCWAASVAALLNDDNETNGGSSWTQDDIIRATAAHRSDQSGTEVDMMLALAPTLRLKYLNARAQFEQRPHKEGIMIVNTSSINSGYYVANTPWLPDAQGLVDAIAKGDPIIVAIDPERGSLGHVVVATGVRYSVAATDVSFGTTARYFIHELFAIDPRDGKPTSFSANTANGDNRSMIDRVSFAVSRPVAQEYVTGSISAYEHPVFVMQQQQQKQQPKQIRLKF